MRATVGWGREWMRDKMGASPPITAATPSCQGGCKAQNTHASLLTQALRERLRVLVRRLGTTVSSEMSKTSPSEREDGNDKGVIMTQMRIRALQ